MELEHDTLRMMHLSERDLQPTIDKERREAQRRLKAYRGDRPPLDLTGKIAILVDDGIATGSTAKASLRMLRKSTHPRQYLSRFGIPSMLTARHDTHGRTRPTTHHPQATVRRWCWLCR